MPILGMHRLVVPWKHPYPLFLSAKQVAQREQVCCRRTDPVPSLIGYQRWVQIFGWSEDDSILFSMRLYSLSSPGYSSCKLDICICTDISKPNPRSFPAEMRTTWSHIPSQSSSRHPRKGCLPEMVKSNERFVTLLDAGIVLRTKLISRKTVDSFTLHLMMASSLKIRMFERSLRFTRPVRGSCLSFLGNLSTSLHFDKKRPHRYPRTLVYWWDTIPLMWCEQHRG